MSFVFFDTETTGLRHGFDQIVHFAAIRTDADLNEIDRFEAHSRLLPHVVPHPFALYTNGLSIGRLTDDGLPSHYVMVQTIRRKLLSWSPSIFVGYNSIRFDEEMLRQAFFQTLHPAYLTSNHGNCRADALGLMTAAAALSPSCLLVPFGATGRPTFRLEQLASANGIEHTRAHDAMADVLATLGLCRCVYERSSELWQRFVRFSKKATVADFVDSEDAFILTEFFSNEAYHAPVVCLGRDPEQPNGRLCLRLDGDVGRFYTMSDEDLRVELARKPSPIRRFRINAAPTLTALYDARDQMLNGIDLDEVETRARRVKDDPTFCAHLISAYASIRGPHAPSRHVEEQIYDRFPGPDDEARMERFHKVGWREVLSIVQSFEDERLRCFGLRLVYFEHRSVLPEEIRLRVERELTDRLVEEESGGLTLRRALQETDALLGSDYTDTNGILADYRAYLVDRITRVSNFRHSIS
ncbi:MULTISPECIES: exonuclease domain-containing protein [Parvibaculum]|uniref:Exodeoxyribonuclease I n=1 Tax=Parvibaculum lavamentivorans (strain DS-1 / DSM 13023 / NCIMB 13966) TaxID=402881 RepID=A7HU56_PARL1|nr:MULTISPECIES: exonuclease domain-containing protein [Parvibaculum]ABS63439.1 Exodeoxyribonuclease I [Parvibaculum lavamentivorans DS-1]MCW5726826.1 exodeoxyribonuclease I [Parvibaculum sp.]MDP1628697.1 exonuclease domain-containing protein [Parvibaculum sp.]MDP2150193.1 exonuclease domain-containing protein [Parvibaculum sp.]MDP3328200.1 exonuclease domain-containing protein [Parvibaculum sp.]